MNAPLPVLRMKKNGIGGEGPNEMMQLDTK